MTLGIPAGSFQASRTNAYMVLIRVAASGSSLVPDLTTVDCSLYGGTRATSAVCTGYSTVDGMGNMTAAPVTTTLAGSQVNYVAVTITAGLNGSATG
ncbi:hypothetical protein LTR53_020171, partial [Teratosphaeriaceae sp. CCFEE 6253]